jgi:hypothetical protein
VETEGNTRRSRIVSLLIFVSYCFCLRYENKCWFQHIHCFINMVLFAGGMMAFLHFTLEEMD